HNFGVRRPSRKIAENAKHRKADQQLHRVGQSIRGKRKSPDKGVFETGSTKDVQKVSDRRHGTSLSLARAFRAAVQTAAPGARKSETESAPDFRVELDYQSHKVTANR